MRVRYIFSNQTYLITSHAVAANPLFEKSIYCKRFLEKANKYLGPLCDIISYSLLGNEFQLIIKMKSRKDFISYYKKHRKANNRSFDKVPHSTYIFSDAIAKLLSSIAVHFNWKEKRSGALFASRFKKVLIEGAEKLDYWMRRLKKLKRYHVYKKRWRHKVKGFRKKGVRKRVKLYNNSGYLKGDKASGKRHLELQKAVSRTGFQGLNKKTFKVNISKKDLLLFLEIRHQIKII